MVRPERFELPTFWFVARFLVLRPTNSACKVLKRLEGNWGFSPGQSERDSSEGKTIHDDKPAPPHPPNCYCTLDRRSRAPVPCSKGSAPVNDHVSWLAIALITLGHLVVSAAVWWLSNKFAGAILLIFLLLALSADLYEHFLHASSNNVFTVASGDWTARFNVSVFVLLALEIVGCLLGVLLLIRRARYSGQAKVAG